VNDGVALTVSPNGQGRATLVFGKIPLLKGRYTVTVFLTTEDGVHPYDQALHCVSLQVTQQGIEQGVVSLPHVWQT
jgi:lipopolysaccharide transport system ATP-binding protein